FRSGRVTTNLSSIRATCPTRKSRPIPKKAGLIYFRDAALFIFRTPAEKIFRIIFSEDFPGPIVPSGSKSAISAKSFAAGTFIIATAIGRCRYEQRLRGGATLQ